MAHRLGFSTLGCPKWPWAKVLEQASALGYQGIELRGLEGEMDLTKRPEFSALRIAETRRSLADRGLVVSDLGASAKMHERDPAKRATQLDEAHRFINLAHDLGVPWIRVFPDEYLPDESHESTQQRIGETLAQLGTFANGSGVGVLMESHGALTDSPSIAAIIKAAGGAPNVGLVWDTHHTVVEGHEKPADTWAALGKWVHHTHIKDSVAQGDDRHYVLLGQGTVGVQAIVQALVQGGYDGFFGLEWEKAWHPDIDEPEVAFPQYIETMKKWLQDASPSAA